MAENHLTTAQLKEYLEKLKDLEVSCFEQAQVIARLQDQPNRIQYDIAAIENSQQVPEKPFGTVGNIFSGIVSGLLYGLVGVPIGAIIGLIVRSVAWKITKTSGYWPFIKWGAIIGYAVLFAVFCIGTPMLGKRDTAKYKEKLKEFEKQQGINNSIIAQKQCQLSNIPKEIQNAEKKYWETRQLLDQYYDLGYIYESYRGIVPICTMYQYFDSGRCTTLEGHEGAYNLYENELRMNMILGRLDSILEKLDEISGNQMILAQELRKCSAKVDEISGSIDRIEENTALTQYYSGITAANTNYLAWLNTIQYIDSKKH